LHNFFFLLLAVIGGNQRDIDRARAQARAQKSGSGAGKKPEDDVRHTSKMEA